MKQSGAARPRAPLAVFWVRPCRGTVWLQAGLGLAQPPWQRSSESFNVSVLLSQDGDLVFKEDRVEPHLRVDQRHIAKPAGESVHAALPLGEVVRVSPARGPGRLCGEQSKKLGGGCEEAKWQAPRPG